MSDSFTSNYGFTKPTVTGTGTGWDSKLNTNFDQIDQAIFNAQYGALNIYPNILVNGGFAASYGWQRGTSFSSPANTTYTADRWRVLHDAAPTFTVSQETTLVDTGSSAAAKVNITNIGAGTYLQLDQTIENFAEFSGKTVSVSARVKTSIANQIRVGIWNGAFYTFSGYHTGSNTYETLTATVTIPNPCTALQVSIGFYPTGFATGIFYVDNVMLVIGSTPINYLPADPQRELARCQRYYEKSYDAAVVPATHTTIGNEDYTSRSGDQLDRITCRFRTTKRTTPTVTLYGSTSGTSGKWWDFTASADLAATTANVGTSQFTAYPTSNATSGHEYQFHWTADAEI